MSNWEQTGTTDPATHICGADSCKEQEWKVEISDELDEERYPMFEACVVVGSRWYDHEHIDWTFDLENSTTDEEIQGTLESFKKFRDAVIEAYDRFALGVEVGLEARKLQKVVDKPDGTS